MLKQSNVTLLKLLKKWRSCKYIVTPNMFWFCKNHLQGASGTSKAHSIRVLVVMFKSVCCWVTGWWGTRCIAYSVRNQTACTPQSYTKEHVCLLWFLIIWWYSPWRWQLYAEMCQDDFIDCVMSELVGAFVGLIKCRLNKCMVWNNTRILYFTSLCF
jgi:hypothetical protein